MLLVIGMIRLPPRGLASCVLSAAVLTVAVSGASAAAATMTGAEIEVSLLMAA
jgi:hypothetical protein